MIAMVILSVIALSLGRFVGNFLHAVGTSTVRTVATEVAQEQIENIRYQSTTSLYGSIVATYNNVTTTGFPGYPNMVRTTRILRTINVAPRRDYTTVTVTVTEPTMGTAVNTTTVIGSP
jgi:Tfp pilus assembly protein PilV